MAALLAVGHVLGHVLPTSAYPVDPATPARLRAHADVQPLQHGYIDVTLPPYRAAGDGVRDDARALQSAVADAYTAAMSVYLPAGRTFLSSEQLLCREAAANRSTGFRIVGGGDAAAGTRPVLKLKDRALPLPNATFVMFELVDGGPPGLYQAQVRNVVVDLGDNPGVSGVSMSAAQLSTLEDVAVVGREFYAGFNGLPGSGGVSVNLAVSGGEYGIVENQYRPNPSAAGVVLLNQTKAGVLVQDCRGPLVLSGFRIEGPGAGAGAGAAAYAAVVLSSDARDQDHAFAGEDGVMVRHPVPGAARAVAVDSTAGDVTLLNVFMHGYAAAAANRIGDVTVPTGAGAVGQWVRIPELAVTASHAHVWDGGRERNTAASGTLAYAPVPFAPGVPPPPSWSASPGAGHAWGAEDALPTMLDGDVVDVVAAYGATPQWVDATDDDGAAIQAAIDAVCDEASPLHGRPVFIPHGRYGLRRPLDVKGCASLIGAGSHSTRIGTLPVPYGPVKSCWPDPGVTGAVLQSTGALAGRVVVADLMLEAPTVCPFVDLAAGALWWRDAGVIHQGQWNLERRPAAAQPTDPYFQLRDGVAGRLYGVPLDHIHGGVGTDNPGPLHVLLLAANLSRGVHIYQASTEHQVQRKQVLIANCTGVHFHSWKYESALHETASAPPTGSGSLAWVQASSDVSVFGASGNYALRDAAVPMLNLTGAANASFRAMVRKPYWAEPPAGVAWVRDVAAARNVTVGGYQQLLLYNV
eukprot:TRINITY_DN10879_c0_g1_i1.p1 TRINITY_DN10879_c0_g1~~TRINITY_DN10879_c0_g1_i1.p1  ORF type:complete len:769 (+),score=226.25 TRINITY_DN10879_c0_g1_i1:60-2309(+)